MSIADQSKNVSTLEDDKKVTKRNSSIWQETNPFRLLDKSKFPTSKYGKTVEHPEIKERKMK